MWKIALVAVGAFFGACVRRLFRGPASPGWTFRLECIVAMQRAALTEMMDWPPARVRASTPDRRGRTARTLEIGEQRLGGVRCERSRRPGSTSDRHLLYIHGGGFAVGSTATHRELVSTVVSSADVCAHSVDYRQPPEHPFPAAVDDVVSAYRALLDSGVPAERVAIAGNSAGGNLCLALLLRSKAERLPLPASAVLICPAPDLALSGASWHRKPYLDYLTRPIAKAWLDHYIDPNVDPERIRDPFASPIHGDLRDLPPILLHAGSNEGLLDEIEALAAALREAKVPLTYTLASEMPHVWHLFVGLVPEASAALDEIAEFVRETTGAPIASTG